MRFFVIICLFDAYLIMAEQSAKNTDIRDLSDDSKNSLLLLLVREFNRLEAKQDELQKLLNNINTMNGGFIEKVSRLESKLDNLQREASSCKLVTCMDTIVTKLRNDVDAIATRLNQSSLLNYLNGTRNCGSGWKEFDRHCYYFKLTADTWENAKNNCEKNGAYLVKIDNEAENKWLALNKPVESAMWIGANDRNLEGTFTWVSDNSALRFSQWRPGEPNDYHGDEDCAYMFEGGDGFWNDSPCGHTFSHMCEQ